MRGWPHWVLAAGLSVRDSIKVCSKDPTPDGRGWGVGGAAMIVCKGLWDHRARTLDLSSDGVERHEGALLLPCLGRVCSWPFYKMETTGLSSGSKHRAGPQASSQTKSRPFAEGGGSDLPSAEKTCVGGGGGCHVPSLPWL